MIRITLRNGSVIDWRGCTAEAQNMKLIAELMSTDTRATLTVGDGTNVSAVVRISEIVAASVVE